MIDYHYFSKNLLAWFAIAGRTNLPWQHPRDAYRVWLSEIMLQQTQVQTVIPYFLKFMDNFPNIKELALASEDSVLALWSGLGYYSRARNLHKTAHIIWDRYQGQFPQDKSKLMELPGIGESTAAAICSQAFGMSEAILDGNVKRTLARHFMVSGWPEQSQTKKQLWSLAKACMPKTQCADYTQAIMDLGALICTPKNPSCNLCPLQETCLAHINKTIDFYPSKKPVKTLPTKQQQFLLLVNEENAIYLEKNPPTGLWGGLWSLPAIAPDQCFISHLRAHYGLGVAKSKSIIQFKHSFSHFHLLIDARLIQIKARENRIAESPGQWFNPQDLKSLGLPKAISKILSAYLQQL